MSDNPKCKTCRWLYQRRLSRSEAYECRLNPPGLTVETEYDEIKERFLMGHPEVCKNYHCGQHSELTEKAVVKRYVMAMIDDAMKEALDKGITDTELANIGLQRIPTGDG